MDSLPGHSCCFIIIYLLQLYAFEEKIILKECLISSHRVLNSVCGAEEFKEIKSYPSCVSPEGYWFLEEGLWGSS